MLAGFFDEVGKRLCCQWPRCQSQDAKKEAPQLSHESPLGQFASRFGSANARPDMTIVGGWMKYAIGPFVWLAAIAALSSPALAETTQEVVNKAADALG